jgi:broad specificity phosphatase PhoE
MAKTVELRRHTEADGDTLTSEGVRAAVETASKLASRYDIAISSGAQRATQTLACFLAGAGAKVPGGVIVDGRFKSDVEDRWKAAYEVAGAGDIESFRKADPDLVEKESTLLGNALKERLDELPDGGRALIVGHSPMHEVAVYGLTGEVVEPLSKGAGVLVTEEDGSYRVDAAG